MASSSNRPRKRPLPQAAEDEIVQVDGRRPRNPTLRQQQKNEDEAARLQAKIDRQKKLLAKQRQKIAEFHDRGVNSDSSESDTVDLESQDDGDMGHGARPGGGFTSVINPKGVIPHSRPLAKKKKLVAENSPFAVEHEPLQIVDMNRTRSSEPLPSGRDDSPGADADMASPSPQVSSPSPRPRSCSPPPSAPVQREHTTPPPPHCIPPERTTPPSPSSSSRAQHTRSMPPSRLTTPSLSSRSQSMHAARPSRLTTPSLSSRAQHTGATPSSQLTTPSSRSEMNRDSQPPPPKSFPPAPFRQGYSPGPKPKASDYEDGVEKMLLNAMHEYACLILATDAFPNEAKQTQWAEATWQAACKEVGVYYECSVRMIRLITGRGSWARSILKDAVRYNFKVFKFKEGSTEEIKHFNQERRRSLLSEDAFHHKNQAEVTGFGENRVIMDILRDALFEDGKSYGVKYSRYFNPISVNLLALVFTMIEFLINEWSTGERKKSTFRSSVYSDTFDTHYLRTTQWCELDPTVTTNIRKRMFNTLMKKAGALEQVDGRSGAAGMTASMKERAMEALAGRTGETDDEDD